MYTQDKTRFWSQIITELNVGPSKPGTQPLAAFSTREQTFWPTLPRLHGDYIPVVGLLDWIIGTQMVPAQRASAD